MRARSASKAERLEKSRALQRVLCRSAKQNPNRRFHRERPPRDCACLAVNGVGKPGAGEPHARFDRGPLAKQQRW